MTERQFKELKAELASIQAISTNEYLDLKQTCCLLGMKETFVRGLISKGLLEKKQYDTNNGKVMFAKVDVLNVQRTLLEKETNLVTASAKSA